LGKLGTLGCQPNENASVSWGRSAAAFASTTV
jgi:hypothetical protein